MGTVEQRDRPEADETKRNYDMATKIDKKGKGKGAKGAKTEKAATKSEGNLTPLKVLCGKLGIEANCATRAKLRRVWRDEDDTRISSDDHRLKRRWDLTPAQVKTATEILTAADA